MKRITSSFVILATAPIKFIKKIKLDTFLGGLIIGAVFSLVVNVITVKITEEVQKQRVLEALESEIVNNAIRANVISQQDQNNIKNKTLYNPFSTIQKYSKDIWQYSPVSLQYVAQLDPNLQSAIITYFTMTVPEENSFLDNLERITSSQLSECVTSEINLNANTSDHCRSWYQTLLTIESSAANDMGKQSYDVLMKFHPTKDRLNNWFLKLLMGDKSTRILSGK